MQIKAKCLLFSFSLNFERVSADFFFFFLKSAIMATPQFLKLVMVRTVVCATFMIQEPGFLFVVRI